jgi:hypothetical protein
MKREVKKGGGGGEEEGGIRGGGERDERRKGGREGEGERYVVNIGVVVIELWWVMIGKILWCGVYLSDGVSGTKGR